MFCWRPVAWSSAVTWTMPFTSISKVTSIWGTPLGGGATSVSMNLPSDVFSWATLASPWSTWTSTLVWLSVTVVKIRLFFVGMLELRSMSGVNVPSLVSMPRVWGVTSRRTRSEERRGDRGAGSPRRNRSVGKARPQARPDFLQLPWQVARRQSGADCQAGYFFSIRVLGRRSAWSRLRGRGSALVSAQRSFGKTLFRHGAKDDPARQEAHRRGSVAGGDSGRRNGVAALEGAAGDERK